MKKFNILTRSRKVLADTLTPVNIYLKLRDVFAGSLLLESSDYNGQENSLSIICCSPLAAFSVSGDRGSIRMPDQPEENFIANRETVISNLESFRKSFQFDPEYLHSPAAGLFGYMNYDGVRFCEEIDAGTADKDIPDLFYQLFRYVIVIDHFSNEMRMHEHTANAAEESGLDQLQKVILSSRFPSYPFRTAGERHSPVSDAAFLSYIHNGIHQCLAGNVFQIVLSRQFRQSFRGDEFNVYRALRSINPSPYLFYFDFVGFKLFGSSPEAQLRVRGREASIFPIAGTFRRTGNDAEDRALAEKLIADEKENAEHLMLVDLARNDLSRSAQKVRVEVLREVQFYSHVIHLVSKVTGTLPPEASALRLMADTFPPGTLSGAPKHKAMSLIHAIEKEPRGFYGGAIGFIGCNGDINHAIMIRTFLSRNNELVSQAGAGVVARSVPASELAEVNNKLEALRKAVLLAETL